MSDELIAAEKARDDHVSLVAELVKQYTGSWYDKGNKPERPQPENHAYQWLTRVMPSVIYNNPAALVESRAGGQKSEIAEGIELALNGWIKSVKLRQVLGDVF